MKHEKSVAIFGGTFDPPTLAHEKIIEYALNQPYLDEVWVMPSGQRADKPHMLDNQTRLEMLQYMKAENFADNPRLKLSDFEINLPQPTHTYTTVQALYNRFAGHEFYFVFGADSYADMPEWERGGWLRDNLKLLLIPRGGQLPAETSRVRHFLVPEVEEMAISSTGVRQALSRGGPVDQFVSQAVAKFLAEHRCYSPAKV